MTNKEPQYGSVGVPLRSSEKKEDSKLVKFLENNWKKAVWGAVGLLSFVEIVNSIPPKTEVVKGTFYNSGYVDGRNESTFIKADGSNYYVSGTLGSSLEKGQKYKLFVESPLIGEDRLVYATKDTTK